MQHLQLFEEFSTQPVSSCVITFQVPRVSILHDPSTWAMYTYRIHIPLGVELSHAGLLQDLLEVNLDELALDALRAEVYTIERPSPPHPDNEVRGIFTPGGFREHLFSDTKTLQAFTESLRIDLWWRLLNELRRLDPERSTQAMDIDKALFPATIKWI